MARRLAVDEVAERTSTRTSTVTATSLPTDAFPSR